MFFYKRIKDKTICMGCFMAVKPQLARHECTWEKVPERASIACSLLNQFDLMPETIANELN